MGGLFGETRGTVRLLRPTTRPGLCLSPALRIVLRALGDHDPSIHSIHLQWRRVFYAGGKPI